MCVSQKIKLIFGKIMGRVGVFRENKVIKLMSTPQLGEEIYAGYALTTLYICPKIDLDRNVF